MRQEIELALDMLDVLLALIRLFHRTPHSLSVTGDDRIGVFRSWSDRAIRPIRREAIAARCSLLPRARPIALAA